MAHKNYVESLLGERERIILMSRQHWFLLVSEILLEIVIIFIIFIGTILGASLSSGFNGIIILVGFLVLLIPIITMILDILRYTNRLYIVTNRRVIQISGIYNKNVIDSSLEKVNDVKMFQSAFGRIFKYGDIEILTASELGVNLFKRIGDPIGFKTAMLNAKDELERGLPPESPSISQEQDIPEMISKLSELRKQGIITEEEFQSKKTELLSKIK